jgi:hypothetical protein
MLVPVSNPEIGIPESISIDPADTAFQLDPKMADSLLLDVDNEDNEPLAITRVASAQSGIYLLAWLEPGNTYRLMAGDPAVAAPKYDLHYFTDSTLLPPVTIGLGTMEPGILMAQVRSAGTPPGRSGQVLLWTVVAITLLLLLLVSVKLARAIDKKGEE